MQSEAERDAVIDRYREWIVQQPELIAALPELQHKHLICWCAPKRCHAEVLLDLARRSQFLADLAA
jgi:hypothetical protein